METVIKFSYSKKKNKIKIKKSKIFTFRIFTLKYSDTIYTKKDINIKGVSKELFSDISRSILENKDSVYKITMN